MIIQDLAAAESAGTKDIHQLVSDSIATYPEIAVERKWREYAVGNMDDQVGQVRRSSMGLRNPTSPMQNMIRMCIRQMVGRLRFKRFVVDDRETQEWLDEYAAKNSIARKVVSIGRRQIIDGNSALSQVWRGGADGMVYVRQEYWMDNQGSGMFVAVDDANNTAWAVANTVDNEDVWHRVIYLPDSIKHYTGGSATAAGDGWTLVSEDDWTDANGDPLGVPVSHFPNSDPDYGPYGTSTVGEVVSVQDALNLSLFNRMAISAATGQQIMWGTGVKEPEPGSVGPGTFLSSVNDNAKFGSIPPGSIEGVLKETDDLRSVVSGAFPVPSYRIGSGDWPSGLALQRSDGPMLTAVLLLRDVITPGLIHHAHRATVMNNTFGTGDLNTEALISVEWESIDQIDPSTESEIQNARAETLAIAEGLSEVSMRKTGMFTEEEIKKIIAERDAMSESAQVLGEVNEEDL